VFPLVVPALSTCSRVSPWPPWAWSCPTSCRTMQTTHPPGFRPWERAWSCAICVARPKGLAPYISRTIGYGKPSARQSSVRSIELESRITRSRGGVDMDRRHRHNRPALAKRTVAGCQPHKMAETSSPANSTCFAQGSTTPGAAQCSVEPQGSDGDQATSSLGPTGRC